jgi:hypothetical protein
MATPNFQSLFNDHFMEFIDAIQTVFPDNVDILSAKNSLTAIRKANPKLIVKIWNKYIIGPYQNQINEGNIEFFLEKDYSKDLVYTSNQDQIMDAINRLREPVRQMNPKEQQNVMKYLQNLSKLANLHFAANPSALL